MQQQLISRSKFAKLAGVNRSTVTRLCSTLLQATMVGKRIDAAHSDAIKYLNRLAQDADIDALYENAVEACKRTGKYTATNLQTELHIGYSRALRLIKAIEVSNKIVTIPEIKPRKQKIITTSEVSNKIVELLNPKINKEEPENIQDYTDMTLRDLIHKFGTGAAFLDWLRATKEIEVINEKRLRNAQTQGKLVSRELVKIGIIEPLDSAHIKLLTDGAKTITRRVTAMHGSGRTLNEIEKFVKDQITSFIRPVKAKVKRALKNA